MTVLKSIKLLYAFIFFLMSGCIDKPIISDIAPKKEDEDAADDVLIYEVSTIAGVGVSGIADGDLVTGAFNTPIGITEELDGELFIADQTNHKIRKIILGQSVSTYAGTGVAGFVDGIDGQFNRPYGVAVDSKGNIFLADYANHSVIFP